MFDRYAGWKPLITRARAIGEEFGELVQVQPKQGYLRLSAGFSAPAELVALLDEIEQESGSVCQFCGRPGAFEQQHRGAVYIVCSGAFWVRRITGETGSSCPV